MRIGILDNDSSNWFGTKNSKTAREVSSNDMKSPFSNNSNSAPDAETSDTKAPVSGAAGTAPRMTAPGAPKGTVSGGAPGSASGGAANGGANAGRTVMWKGKALNMDTTRSALTQAAAAEHETALAASQSTTIEAVAASQALHEHVSTILTGMDEMCGGLQEIYGVLTKISERDTAGERVFNTLHAELSDYKKDFIYEHLKPVVRPLLFLYDSLEQFEEEIERFDPQDAQPTATEKSGVMPTRVVRQNTIYFREQLVEALRICEVTPMDDPNGVFNPRFHKAVKVVPVADEQDGSVQRIVRSGWFLNGHLLRPAEVVVGKKTA